MPPRGCTKFNRKRTEPLCLNSKHRNFAASSLFKTNNNFYKLEFECVRKEKIDGKFIC